MAEKPDLTLASCWIDDGSKTGAMQLDLRAAPGFELPAGARLAYTAITRIPPGTKLVGARYIARTANYHELAPLDGEQALVAADNGLLWQIRIPELSHRPNHYTDGPKSAFLILPNGDTEAIVCDPLQPDPSHSSKHVGTGNAGTEPSAPPVSRLGALPALPDEAITRWCERAPQLALPQEEAVARSVMALHDRLFCDDPTPFDAAGVPVSLQLRQTKAGEGDDECFVLTFGEQGIAVTGAQSGLFHGLVALVQIWRSARLKSEYFSFPADGAIATHAQHDWRGIHLDVSRQVYSAQSIRDFLDILAWNRFNRCHLHLTDDEGWRLESLAYPTLTHTGAWRGHGLPLLPQHGSGAARHGGFFTREDVKAFVAHADPLHIDIVPEIDVPGHCYAALQSVPELLDPSAMSGGASVQGYVNNALNPGLGATWRFLETIFGELCDLFPSRFIHMGGDEVADGAWAGSRSANSWARAKGHVTSDGAPYSMKMQAAMLRFVSDRLVGAGRTPVAWEEAAKGGGLDPDTAILMAWMKGDSGPMLARAGYRVVMCPGEVYYLDMAQSHAWQEPGLSWAGTASPKTSHDYDPMEPFGGPYAVLAERMIGVQGCIWSENLVSRSLFNHMVFPRLSAIAETGWSDPSHKTWQGFAERAALMPAMPQTPQVSGGLG